ncbi:hypothetical protein WR25_07757 [Diploscapter pachys]|uniref:Uncharacterized protein n=1 Tax=Diploscapter pachys TaxID=2018661 RepID=A0A2A2LAE8_9BILA|nr:hypothetical protein WR25_07757 [Diploscapter pachys]
MDKIKIPVTEFTTLFLFAAIFTAGIAWVGQVGLAGECVQLGLMTYRQWTLCKRAQLEYERTRLKMPTAKTPDRRCSIPQFLSELDEESNEDKIVFEKMPSAPKKMSKKTTSFANPVALEQMNSKLDLSHFATLSMDKIKIPVTEFTVPFFLAGIVTAGIALVGRIGLTCEW